MVRLIVKRESRQAQYFTEELSNDVGLDMVLIPSGSFWMGTEDSEIESLVKEYAHKWIREERPQHKVTLPYFFMGRYPITQAQWQVVAGWEQVERELKPEPSNFQEDYEGISRWQRPVEKVSWEDAKEFCSRLSKKNKREYRLPTEAEWEYACRAIPSQNSTVEEWNEKDHQPFHFGETISTEVANYSGNSTYGRGVTGKSRKQTTPVGYFNVANNFGLSDMHGNVWEWCEDDWHDSYDNAPNDGSAWLSEEVDRKILRGGSWYYYPNFCRSAYRDNYSRENRYNNIGFRVACVAPGLCNSLPSCLFALFIFGYKIQYLVNMAL